MRGVSDLGHERERRLEAEVQRLRRELTQAQQALVAVVSGLPQAGRHERPKQRPDHLKLIWSKPLALLPVILGAAWALGRYASAHLGPALRLAGGVSRSTRRMAIAAATGSALVAGGFVAQPFTAPASPAAPRHPAAQVVTPYATVARRVPRHHRRKTAPHHTFLLVTPTVTPSPRPSLPPLVTGLRPPSGVKPPARPPASPSLPSLPIPTPSVSLYI